MDNELRGRVQIRAVRSLGNTGVRLERDSSGISLPALTKYTHLRFFKLEGEDASPLRQ